MNAIFLLAEQSGKFVLPMLSRQAVLPEIRDLQHAGGGFQRFLAVQFHAQLLLIDLPELFHFPFVGYGSPFWTDKS